MQSHDLELAADVAETQSPGSATPTLRVNIVADLLEEQWPSMDLVADMLMSHLGQNGAAVTPVLLRPNLAGSARQALFRRSPRVGTLLRVRRRFYAYPRWLRKQPPADVYHIVDHSYAHLAGVLPGDRVIATCHDTDAFRSLTGTHDESRLPRMLVQRVLAGLRRAAIVACDSEATRADLVDSGLLPVHRTRVVPLGVDPACTEAADSEADAAAARLTGPTGSSDLLHVGSTIQRKRIDTLVEVVARVAVMRPDVRLWQVGGELTPAQRARVAELRIADRIRVLPFVTRPVLAALYRRAALTVLPSEREGFGLPLVESLACGTPVAASSLPVLEEVGRDAAEYCPVGDTTAWTASVLRLLAERDARSDLWTRRRAAGIARAAQFSWKRYVSDMERLYLEVAVKPGAART